MLAVDDAVETELGVHDVVPEHVTQGDVVGVAVCAAVKDSVLDRVPVSEDVEVELAV